MNYLTKKLKTDYFAVLGQGLQSTVSRIVNAVNVEQNYLRLYNHCISTTYIFVLFSITMLTIAHG